MKLLAFAASTSTQSINRRLVKYASRLVEEGHVASTTVTLLDLNDYEMPIYSADREQASGIPALAHAFFKEIGQADALLVSFAEHNGSYTAAYKNTFDWASRINGRVFQDKPMVLLATSPGGRGGASVLKTAVDAAPRFGGQVKASFSLPKFAQNFDLAKDHITDPELDAQLREALSKLATTAA